MKRLFLIYPSAVRSLRLRTSMPVVSDYSIKNKQSIRMIKSDTMPVVRDYKHSISVVGDYGQRSKKHSLKCVFFDLHYSCSQRLQA